MWADDDDGGLSNVLSRLSINEPRLPFYSFGSWGYHTNAHDSQIMPGFSSTPPGTEICSNYKIIYLAAVRYDTSTQQANILLRHEPKSGWLTIREYTLPFNIGVGGIIMGGMRRGSSSVTSPTIFDGRVDLHEDGSSITKIDQYFGPGYNFYGFEDNSAATKSCPSMATNATLIVTKRNDNKGRLYKVNAPKAFKLVHEETGIVTDESAPFESQEEEAREARKVCKSRHYSFLCHELGLPCSASALITQFVGEHKPYIFAEPGDIWIDVRLSTPVRTYVLARPTNSPLPTQVIRTPASLLIGNDSDHDSDYNPDPYYNYFDPHHDFGYDEWDNDGSLGYY